MGTAAEDFLAEMLPKQVAAETAIHNGDPEPRLALWSRTDPVTLFGARDSGTGWNDLSAIFHNVASWFSDSAEYDFEVVTAGASGDCAYTVGYEHNQVKVDRQPRAYTLRVTHVYRRENGQWRIVHRHGDFLPAVDYRGAPPLAAGDTTPSYRSYATETVLGREVEEFLTEMLPKQLSAIKAYHNGDVQPRLAMWSHRDPVTLFGAWVPLESGWDNLSRTFASIASRFAESRDFRIEVVAAGASGDLAYTVAFEDDVMNIDGASRAVTMRATHVYRREDGEWKIVHRHSDFPPAADQSIAFPAPAAANTASR
jgi:ketosteroid isomerase-like protein